MAYNLDELIYRIETLEQNQNMVDDIYGNMCQKMFNEMDNCLGYKDYSSKTTAKRLRVHKPYDNE